MMGEAVKVIDVSEHKPRHIPSAKWRELNKKVWEADPLVCPRCSHEMRIVALIDERAVIERVLRHLGLWEQGVRVSPSAGPPAPVPGERIIELVIGAVGGGVLGYGLYRFIGCSTGTCPITSPKLMWMRSKQWRRNSISKAFPH